MHKGGLIIKTLITKTWKIQKKIALFLNIVSFQIDIVFSAKCNSFATLFIITAVEPLESAVNRRFHLFIIGKYFSNKPFFQTLNEEITEMSQIRHIGCVRNQLEFYLIDFCHPNTNCYDRIEEKSHTLLLNTVIFFSWFYQLSELP